MPKVKRRRRREISRNTVHKKGDVYQGVISTDPLTELGGIPVGQGNWIEDTVSSEIHQLEQRSGCNWSRAIGNIEAPRKDIDYDAGVTVHPQGDCSAKGQYGLFEEIH
jgi:hypothetical protein